MSAEGKREMFPTGTGGYSNSFTPLVSRPSVLSETPSIATNGDLREHYVQSLLREKTVLVQELTQKDRLIHELFQYIKALEAELAARQRIPKPVNVGASSTHHVPLMRTGLDQQATSIGLERPGACILSDTISVSYPEGLVTRSPSPSATQSGLNPIPTPATTPSSTCESVLPQELPPREVLAPVEKGQPTAGDETNKHAPPFLADGEIL